MTAKLIAGRGPASDFVGGDPPFLLFEIQFHSLFYVVESHKGDVGDGQLQYPSNPAADVAFIGLVAHFEAFCKHQFAALINANQNHLSRFAERRSQTTIVLSDAAMLLNNSGANVGAVVAEQYDFGSAAIVNGLFRDLVGVTPFSKDQIRTFDRFLSERHLLVHHGGICTSYWLKNGSDSAKKAGAKMFHDRLSICSDGYHERGDFFFDMAIKVARTTVAAARECAAANGISASEEDSYTAMLQGLYDSLE